jgi:hypothetical protein
MNYTALQNRVQDLCSFGGWTDLSSTPDYGDLVNRGYRQVCWNTQVYKTTATITTVASQNLYTLSGTDIIAVYDSIYGTSLPMFPSSELEQRRQDYLWMFRAAGSPRYYWMQNPNQIYLYPAPATSGDTITLYLSRLPADLSSGSDLPVFPVTFHDAIAYRAACFLGERYATGDEMARLQLYMSEATRLEADMMNWLGFENKPAERYVQAVVPRRRR